MKRKKITAGILLLISIWILPYLTAQPAYAENLTGTIKLQLTQLEGTSYEDVGFSLYKVGTWSTVTQSWTLDSAFSDSGITLSSLTSNSAWDSAAKTLAAHSGLSSITPTTITTDAAGKATTSDLGMGMYLVVQTSAKDTYGTVSSFLVGLPVRQDDGITYTYTQEVNPKATKTTLPPTGDGENDTGNGNGTGNENGSGTGDNGSSGNGSDPGTGSDSDSSSNSGPGNGNSSSGGATNTTDTPQLVPKTEEILAKADQGTAAATLETELSDAAIAGDQTESSVLPEVQEKKKDSATGQMQEDEKHDDFLTEGKNAGVSEDIGADSNADGMADANADTNGTSPDGGMGTMGKVAAAAGGIAAIGCGIAVAIKAMGHGSMIGFKRRKK